MKLKNGLMLTLTAFIWGTTFVAQSVGMDYLTTFQFNAIRCLLGEVVLLPIVWVRVGGKQKQASHLVADKKMTLIAGCVCGVIMFGGSTFQQIGVSFTTAGKAGFITSTYIVIVPLLGLFLKKRVGLNVWIAEVFALVGLYLLSIKENFTVGKGDIFVLICALIFSLHILSVDYFVQYVDGVLLSCMQFFVAGVLSSICMVATKMPTLTNIRLCTIPILYAGVLSCGVAYTFQILGQKDMNPTIASLIMSLESTFSVLGGWVVLHEALSLREGMGCILMFVAIMLAQIPTEMIQGIRRKEV